MFARLIGQRAARLACGALGCSAVGASALGGDAYCDARGGGGGDTAYTAAQKSAFSGRVHELKRFVGIAAQEEEVPVILVSPTFYPSVQDTRCQLGLQACRNAKQLGLPLLLVDASPPDVRAALEEAGAIVRPQTRPGKKGAALREAIELAADQLPPDGVICFGELEKVEMPRFWRQVAAHMHAEKADVCVPRREDAAFRRSYPIEQYHSEHFANAYLDSLGRGKGLPPLDWTFGPVALRASAAPSWLANEGELWDAQIVPFVHAARWQGARITTLAVSYEHPTKMKSDEEGKPRWSEKRLDQLSFLFKYVGDALRTNVPPPTAAPAA